MRRGAILATPFVIGVILAYVRVGGPPVHPLLLWFGVAVLLGAIVDRWAILWAAVVPSGLVIIVLIAFMGTAQPDSSVSEVHGTSVGDLSSMVIIALVAALALAIIGVWGIVIGFALRAALSRAL